MDNGASSYRRFLDGDDSGIVEIIRDYKDGLIFFLNRYVNNIHTAEELTEETFFRVVTRKPKFSGRCSFKTWLYTIGRNTAVNFIKRDGRTIPILDEDMFEAEDTLEKLYLQKEQSTAIHHALARLRTDYAGVLHLKFFEDMDNEQIARIMKKNKRQIENLIYQAKRAMRAELDKEGFNYEGL